MNINVIGYIINTFNDKKIYYGNLFSDTKIISFFAKAKIK